MATLLHARYAALAAGFATALLAAGAPAAAQDLRGFALVHATRSIDFYARDERGVGTGDADDAERFLSEVRQRLGASGAGRRLSYYRVAERVELAGLAGHDADGVTSYAGDRVVALQTCNRHELVHVAALELGNPGRFFQEGLAVALARDKNWRGRALSRAAKQAVGRAPLRRFVESFESLPAHDAYAVAGAFVEHLIERYGLAAVADFFRGAREWNRRGWAQQRENAFRAAFGTGLDEAAADWRAHI